MTMAFENSNLSLHGRDSFPDEVLEPRAKAVTQKFYIIHAVCSVGNNPRRVN